MKEWEKNIRKIDPYVPGEQPHNANMIKLNTNENPYPPSPGVLHALENFDVNVLRLYPDDKSKVLVDTLAEYYHVNSDQIFVGVGSDEVLGFAFLTFFNSVKPIVFSDITYSFYKVWAKLYKIPYTLAPLDEDFRMKKEDFYEENGGVIIANPNAPTGICENLEFIEDILLHNQDVVVIVDEAYIDFGGKSALELIDRYENLLVVRTFSKSRSLAGMRIGFCMGNARLIQAMNDVKYSFNSYTMNQVSIVVGAQSVRDEAYFRENVAKIIAQRTETENALRMMGFTCLPSATNFIFAKHNKKSGKELLQKLREKNIYVRNFPDNERIKEYLRITIGSKEQMDVVLKELKQIVME